MCNNTYCGVDCEICFAKENCKGCKNTEGRPFGGPCVSAECIKANGFDALEKLKETLINEFNALKIKNMPKVDRLVALNGSFVNLEYELPNGNSIKLLDDTKIYLGYQLENKTNGRCFGLVADEEYLLVCEYGFEGSDPKIIAYVKR